MVAFHDLANAFPLIQGEEFGELVADIKEHGLHQPLVMHEGKILDGRNRYRACQELGIPHTEKTYTGDDPAAYVWSVNAVRRQLTAAQRALAATKLVTARQGGARPGAGRKPKSGEAKQGPAKDVDTGTTLADAAGMAGVARSTVAKAKRVVVQAVPEVVEAVESGEMSLATAERISGLSEQEQMEIMEAPAADRAKATPRAQRTRNLRLLKEEGSADPRTVMVRQMEHLTGGEAGARADFWEENSGEIAKLDPDPLAAFLKDLKAQRRALSRIITVIEMAQKP
jgi:ParB-like chromosome segregation protein Spo0J